MHRPHRASRDRWDAVRRSYWASIGPSYDHTRHCHPFLRSIPCYFARPGRYAGAPNLISGSKRIPSWSNFTSSIRPSARPESKPSLSTRAFLSCLFPRSRPERPIGSPSNQAKPAPASPYNAQRLPLMSTPTRARTKLLQYVPRSDTMQPLTQHFISCFSSSTSPFSTNDKESTDPPPRVRNAEPGDPSRRPPAVNKLRQRDAAPAPPTAQTGELKPDRRPRAWGPTIRFGAHSGFSPPPPGPRPPFPVRTSLLASERSPPGMRAPANVSAAAAAAGPCSAGARQGCLAQPRWSSSRGGAAGS
ncbi:hypothetical protein BC834DRAFT_655426 [Gloeopeniophorella convolvens]|nr:hypothetical protein BC834DRAFT_655426 [Gloeopeniophorella convolvens]